MLDLTPQSKKISIQIGGMTCQSCANRIEKVLNKKPFVQQAGVNFAVEEAQVVFDATQASETQIIEIIHKTGFSAHIKQANELPIEENTSIPWRLIILWIINIPFLIGMLGMMSGSHHLMLPPIWQFALASIVQLWLAIPFYRGAIGSIRGGLANMDVLVSTGTLTIYLYSAFMLFYHADHAMGHVYFEASVMVIGFVSLGKFLEDRTKKHSLNSLSMLLQLTPKKVTVLRNEKWSEIALDQVNIGEIIRANQGERIAADGIIESGNGWCDESHLTGESRPEEKQKGGKVLAGAMVTEGSIIYRANQLGSQTLLGDMMNALSDAQGSKAPIARFADKVASVFVPVVLVISLVTFALTYILTNDSVSSLIHAVSVLVIACPCALGLATPAAIMVGLGKAVNAGVWFKDAAAMEETAHVDTVVLDKTGTLTKGELEISALWQPQSAVYSEDDLYRFAAAVERQANHPIAKAIVQAAEQKMLEIPTALFSKMEVGQGIQAELEQVGTIKVGKPDYCGLILPKNLEDIWQIASIVAVSINDEPIGAFALTDTLKNDSLHAIQRLQQQNIDVVIMSGDQQSVVDYIAKQLGIKKAFGKLTPRDKAEQIQKLKAQGHIVAMVGDGINDAPALATANVSFAMKSGSDIAEQTASATLMQHSVNQLVDALFIARATLKNIKQNLFFALIYNILGIPLAAFGFLSPIIAGAAMALSSISVLMNALRLKKVRF
ncbi:TPA: heavy metal translocating P-type ATPase [Haemophilus influenzae]|uniref:heavy metal translocating P-type ATPase n=2 Tax=Haemophilus influenzae TaxID=727 RepID=UPI00093909F0|nr:heavy metal translocating P-type ATPase [Haemophilus influenzae]MCK8791082.1 heavy metal translocating P-type ATPase [Haemophilus influenzae]MCK8844518.1 heavy metal translocating P-type ATPase [Haemophilus influenzae]MCK8851712.1 heavy metal translocating P-type ATPase [Haemophilus influenzae]MCK9024408.1 heavy metal translocating P-type ATPase [Haemophilus influenzae]MCK9026957.1 heavy metal translocating P-type ATPase [Haemophilus influenzae]